MMLTRRGLLWAGGGLAALAPLKVLSASGADAVEITMDGRIDGSRVWFNPIGVLIEPGQTVRWINTDRANTHSATAYHPDNFGKPRRIPQGAEPWNSGLLSHGESYSVTFTEPGVYDYYCIPHELAGMVGRIIVGEPRETSWLEKPTAAENVPEAALKAFPPVEQIMQDGVVRGGPQA